MGWKSHQTIHFAALLFVGYPVENNVGPLSFDVQHFPADIPVLGSRRQIHQLFTVATINHTNLLARISGKQRDRHIDREKRKTNKSKWIRWFNFLRIYEVLTQETIEALICWITRRVISGTASSFKLARAWTLHNVREDQKSKFRSNVELSAWSKLPYFSTLPAGAECIHRVLQLAPHNAIMVLLFRIKMKSSIPSAVISLLMILSIRLILFIILRT